MVAIIVLLIRGSIETDIEVVLLKELLFNLAMSREGCIPNLDSNKPCPFEFVFSPEILGAKTVVAHASRSKTSSEYTKDELAMLDA